jgi:ethanolamine utilization protein EutN
MQIARVVGDLTATQKHESHQGKTLLLVQPLQLDGSDRGAPVVAVDSVGAGVGDRVLLVQDGFAAFTSVGLKQAPLDSAVIGIVDQVELISEVAVPALSPAPEQKKKKNRP